MSPPVENGGVKKRKGKGKNSQSKSTEPLKKDEEERRKIQRELQQLASKLREEGKDYKPQKFKRKVYVEHNIQAGVPKPRKQKSKHATPKWRPLQKTQVIIIPIFWNTHHVEKDSVMKAAARVESLLAEVGIETTTDAANQYTPGQKMKYWETAGVRVRVELGPKDAQNGTAVVALSGEPGTVAQKKTVNVVTQLVKEVQATLKAAGVDDSKKPEGQEGQEGQGVTAASGEGQQGELGEQGQAKKKQKKAGKEKAASEGKQQPQKEDIKPASESESASEEEQEGRDESGSEGGDATVEEQKPSGGAAQPDGKQQGKSKRKQQAQLEQQEQRGQQKSGQTEQEDEEEGKAQPFANAEELTDDFELDPEFMQEPEEAALTMTKKERMKAAKKTEKMRKRKGRYGDGVRAWDDDGSAPADGPGQDASTKKKAKLVVFK